jgi:hypothetical protein
LRSPGERQAAMAVDDGELVTLLLHLAAPAV